ncbi:hypothetical protein GRI62_07375 [Erythrobacter arachoides]|uniref:Uncharacterized protein n=1 Tax=Aurantiacibacter arachoides TaxID=1850444 RepID=A0A844ZZU9_9SPHN|nr:hypothetical protein [Aurantiacibacter arachoides]MXO93425.1 hypothetical protein [Aurantiacibacter arachoides]GGD49500.1 hypothetical protein GCM10011411_06570 [Aurantiacibacter arachoides]
MFSIIATCGASCRAASAGSAPGSLSGGVATQEEKTKKAEASDFLISHNPPVQAFNFNPAPTPALHTISISARMRFYSDKAFKARRADQAGNFEMACLLTIGAEVISQSPKHAEITLDDMGCAFTIKDWDQSYVTQFLGDYRHVQADFRG